MAYSLVDTLEDIQSFIGFSSMFQEAIADVAVCSSQEVVFEVPQIISFPVLFFKDCTEMEALAEGPPGHGRSSLFGGKQRSLRRGFSFV